MASRLLHLRRLLTPRLTLPAAAFSTAVTPTPRVSGIVDEICGLTLLEEAKAKEEKMAFDVKLEGFDAAAKLKIIKELRAFTNLGLKEAKELVEKAPAVLKAGVPKEEAESIAEKMRAVGAKIVLE
ncbi:hypothetical protein PVAP13_9NG114600 [Panicum virgatum]|uniref:Large ribosomal subunit protein bL12 C-terminal domain-containing protein n=1 Tax=Panicum virgatum TaxID=38727 RepID=A0A8T0MDV8_PANVG|nr:hypothetical protein PVAP13_9NG114600 [Panicum virgatum]KAG2535450.1 hypothetical protein PVAP13_9NG114600 [Panicum virgatum]